MAAASSLLRSCPADCSRPQAASLAGTSTTAVPFRGAVVTVCK
jgi:hypothetical protein